MQIVPRSFRFVSFCFVAGGEERKGSRRDLQEIFESGGRAWRREEGFVTQWKVLVLAWKGVSRELDRERASTSFQGHEERAQLCARSDFFEPVSFEERGAERCVKGPIKIAVSRSKNQRREEKKKNYRYHFQRFEIPPHLDSFVSPPRGNHRANTNNEKRDRSSIFPEGRTMAEAIDGKKTGPGGSDENKISRACFSYFGFFFSPLFLFFLSSVRSLSAKVKRRLCALQRK